MDARKAEFPPGPAPRGDGWLLGLLLAATFAIRLVQIDQPIVENYVGRQIPTAMSARNLERGSGFLRPQLDTAPFPNYFLVEPPLARPISYQLISESVQQIHYICRAKTRTQLRDGQLATTTLSFFFISLIPSDF